MIYLDESGYTPDWRTGMTLQPFYVLSAVMIPLENLVQFNRSIRDRVARLGLSFQTAPLGNGFEIKAADIARGVAHWGQNEQHRNLIRDMMLEAPKSFGGMAVLSVINKPLLTTRYVTPGNPYFLALEYILERIEHILRSKNDYGFCIYDQNKRLDSDLHEFAIAMVREGSDLLPALFGYSFPINHILEFSLGNSKNSIGLIVADFFATMTYRYWKDGKPTGCGWWETLEGSLHHSVEQKLQGYGLKEFPV